MTENEKYIYDHFLISIKSGFESLEDIIDDALEAIEEEGWQREIVFLKRDAKKVFDLLYPDGIKFDYKKKLNRIYGK